ncbi:VOC family protein [Asanoa iriomotensis]|uniref:VOC family protein n=1 Tax=Asanoa iriomotensis TaxID=234613 RepID=UPI001EF193BB|nr:VOC family protein [Asanoa iriomotensis]
MANGNRRPLAPVRKLFAAVLGTCALFVVLFGIGMQSLAIVALGIALLVLSVGLVLVNAIRGGERAWVAGTAHVHSVSEPPASAVFGRCELQVLIDAPGVPGRLVRMRDPRVPVAKWPDIGASLPITVAIDDPRHIRIRWDEVLTHAEAAAAHDADLGPYDDDTEVRPRPANGYTATPPVETIETTTADLTDELSGLREPAEPVVVHQTPGGPIVVEGTLVDPPDQPPLTRRAPRPSPRKSRAERAASGGTATATAPPPAPEMPAQRGAAGPNTDRPDDVFDQDAEWAEPLYTERRMSRPSASRGSADAEAEAREAAAEAAAAAAEADDVEGEDAETDARSAAGVTPDAGRRSEAEARTDAEAAAASGATADAGRKSDVGDASEPERRSEAEAGARSEAGLRSEAGAAGSVAGGSVAGTDAPPAADAGDSGTVDSETAADEAERAAAAAAPAAAETPARKPRNGATGDSEDDDVFADLFTAYPSARPGATGATIHGVGLTFLVRDLATSIAFYRDMLGFQEIDSGEHNAVLASGDTRMVLREIKDASPVSRRLVHLNLEVGDVMSVYEDLRAKGVRFTYPPRVVNRGAKLELWAAAFRDPDGHGIAITQWRSR